MSKPTFRTEGGTPVPAVTAEQMREIDRIAEQDFGLTVAQMMENAGRDLALNVIDMLGEARGEVTILAGPGGNGGGGICGARHLHNRGFQVNLVLDREPERLSGSAEHQLHILRVAGFEPVRPMEAEACVRRAALVVDALIGYSLRGSPYGRTAELIEVCNENAARVLALDLPSGVNATTGETPGAAVKPERTMTLALPKIGLAIIEGELILADVGIPDPLYRRLGISFDPFFGKDYWVRLQVVRGRG